MASAPSGRAVSTAIERLLRLTKSKALKRALGWPRVVSPAKGSILMTSAPRSASIIEHQAPAITCVQSSTFSPASGDGGMSVLPARTLAARRGGFKGALLRRRRQPRRAGPLVDHGD